jgi:hypothetical protein
MRTIGSIVSAVSLLVVASPAFAANTLYISHAGAGTKSGTSCADAQSYAYFNSAASWSTSPSGTSIGPGTTVHLCAETYVDATAGDIALDLQCSKATGTSSAPLTVIADQGTTNLFNSAYWNGSKGAIGNTGTCSYTVVNGGGNLTIANQTSGGAATNGTGLAYSAQSYGVGLTNCTDCVVENVTVKNIYVNQGSSASATDTNGQYTTCIAYNGRATGSSVQGSTVSQCKTGIGVSADPNSDASQVTLSHNSISDIDWGINVGGGDDGDTINDLVIHDNEITNWTNWAYPTSAYHQDGVILYNFSNPTAGLTATLYNNFIHGDLTEGSPTGFIYCAQNTSCTVFDNVLVNPSDGHSIFGMLWLGAGSANQDMNVYNNTLVNDCPNSCAPYGPGACIMLNNTSGNAKVENNVCVGPSQEVLYNSYDATFAAFLAKVSASDFNDWYVGGDAWGSQANGATATYAAWRSAGFEAHSIQSNPLLNPSAPPYTLVAGSPAIGLGVDLTGLGIAGLGTGAPATFGAAGACGAACSARPMTGAWDVGAYPYSAVMVPDSPTHLTATVR